MTDCASDRPFIPHHRGANFSVGINIINTRTGDVVPVFTLTATLFEVEPASLAASMTVAVDSHPIDDTVPQITVACPWSSSWPDGVGELVSFRIQLSNGAAIPKIPVVLI